MMVKKIHRGANYFRKSAALLYLANQIFDPSLEQFANQCLRFVQRHFRDKSAH
jgi:hypothetical protein